LEYKYDSLGNITHIYKNKEALNDDTLIYRWGSHTNTNLTPKEKDTDGLSFSLLPPQNEKAVATTIGAINSTGVLVAVQDGPLHVSVRPTNRLELFDWIISRPGAEVSPHPYTILLKEITWDVKGG